jgi:large subunit ribosomal protein L21
MKSYAIISVGGKQYRVQEGDRLLVQRLPEAEDKTFHPSVLMLGGDGGPDLDPTGAQVTARVVGHVLGEKVRIGKYRRRTGYRRHAGHRSKLSQIEIQSIGARRPARAKADEQSAADRVKGMPSGYEDMTVAEVTEGAKTWNITMLEAALVYEQEHGKRKGAISALEHSIESKKESE